MIADNLSILYSIQGSYVYEFTANDFNEVKASLTHDIIAPSASALKHKLQVNIKPSPIL